MPGLSEARVQCMSSVQIEDEIKKSRRDLSSIISQIAEARKSLDSQKENNGQIMTSIQTQCESLDQLLAEILKDMPAKVSECDSSSLQITEATEKLTAVKDALAALPAKMTALKVSYIDHL